MKTDRYQTHFWAKCSICGQFISYKDFDQNLVKHKFTPDNYFSGEESEFWHVKCEQKERKPNKKEL